MSDSLWEELEAIKSRGRNNYGFYDLEEHTLTELLASHQPLASRERVAEVLELHEFIVRRTSGEEWFGCVCGAEIPEPGLGGMWSIVFNRHVADALLAADVFREPPTREQVDELLQEWRVRPPGQPTQVEAVNYRRKMRNAVLALIVGDAE